MSGWSTRRWLLLWCLAWAAIAIAALAPITHLAGYLPGSVRDHHVHFAAHALMVASAILFCRRLWHLLAVAAAVAALGALIEGLQAFLPWRSARIDDLHANLRGVAFGLGVACAWMGLAGLWRRLAARRAQGDAAAAE